MTETDLGTALKGLLSDPEALSGIMSIASGLMSPADKKEADSHNPDESETTALTSVKDASDNVPSLPDLTALMGLIGSQSRKKDPRCELLNALRPFVDRDRCERIDKLIKLIRLADMANGFISGGKLI